MGLFSPTWMSKNEQKALAAVAAVTDENTLVLIVASEKATHAARFKALRQIKDQRLLGDAAGWVFDEKEFSGAVNRIDQEDVLEALKKDVAMNPVDTQERLRIVSQRINDLRNIARANAFRGKLAALDTDEKRVECIRKLGGDYVNDRLCLTTLDAIESKECLNSLLGTVESLSYRVGRAVLRRLGYNSSKQIYLNWGKRFLSSSEICEAAAELTEGEVLALKLDLAQLRELKDSPFLNRAVTEKSDSALVDELIEYIRENSIDAISTTKQEEARWAADWLKVLYRAGRCADKIDACRGEKIKVHGDFPSSCSYPHEDRPAETFEL